MRDVLIKELDCTVFESCRYSLALFIRTFLPEHCGRGFKDFHLEIIDQLERATFTRTKKIALVAPRGYGKSTIVSMAFPIWCMAYGHETYIVILSSTHQRAKDIFDNIRMEVAGNEALKRAAPHLVEHPAKWKGGYAMTAGNVKTIATSIDSEIRGLRSLQNRPSLVLCDDIEGSKNTRTLEARKTFQKKFTQEVLHLGDDKTNVILCGTMLSQDSLQGMIHLEKEIRGWEKLRYKAVIHFSPNGQLWDEWVAIYRGMSSFNQESGRDAAWRFFEARREAMLNGTKVLWNEYEDYYSLMVQKEEIGDYAFCSEKQNDPKEGAGLALDERCRPFWEDDGLTEHEMLRLFGVDLLMFGAADMAYSLKEGADFSVITTALLDRKSRTIYVLDSVGDRWKPEVFISQVVEMHKRRKYIKFVAESNGGQVWFPTADAIRRSHVPVDLVHQKESKDSRIRALFLLIQNGYVKLSKKHVALWEQLSSYPHCRHDDYIDSLAMAVRAAQGHEQDGICTEERVEAMQAFVYSSSRSSSLENVLASSGSYLEARLVDAMIKANT